MILKALYDYYQRCGNLPNKGTELKEIGYLVVLAPDGTFLRLESRMIDKKQANTFLVLQTVKRSGKKYAANYLWDNVEYLFGGEGESNKKKKMFIEQVIEFQNVLRENKNLIAIKNFYSIYESPLSVVSRHELWDEMVKSNKNISFLLEGETKIAAEDGEVWNLVLNKNTINNKYCLISGEKGVLARLHSKIKLTKDTGPLVSFQVNSGYDSYGKTKCYNAPISEEAEFAYTTALNTLLQKDSHNKFVLGSHTFVFWASSNSDASIKTEESLFLLGSKEKKKDDPNANIAKVRKVFEAIYSGKLKTTLEDKFYILGLAPNSARIAVVYWSETILRDFAAKLISHFDDMEIVDTRKEKKPYQGMRNMILTVTLNGKDSDATPNLPESVLKSIFQGLPYPFTLYSACIRRIRAEQQLTIARAAIVKAYLNRLKNDNNEKIKVMLDKENTNQGYLCGRLFAVLDKIQEEANKISSIRERYMNAASATPSSVFATILNLSLHHSEKLSDGRRIYFEKIKQEIIDKLSADGFPTHLDLQNQGRFFVGYYHQRQDFFTGKNEQE